MEQLEFRLPNPPEVDVDGMVDRRGVRFLGSAVQMYDGTWRCLADVAGALCRVEVRLVFGDRPPDGPLVRG